MDQDDELFSSILSLCEEEDVTAEDQNANGKISLNGGARLIFSKDNSISLSPIKYASPVKMAETVKNKDTFTDKFTPKGKSGLDMFKGMLIQQRKTSTPLMDRWSLTRSGQSREGKRRHDVEVISSTLETICEQDSLSDEEQTLRKDEDADKTYDDLLQDLSILCEKELTEKWETINVEPPENKIKAEHQISRINLDDILIETSALAGVIVKESNMIEVGPSQSEPGRFTGVNATTQSSVLSNEDSDSFEDANDVLGLDNFLGSDEEDNDYDSLLEEAILQENNITVLPGSVSTVLSTSTTHTGTVHKTDSVQKIPTYKSINFPTSVSKINSFSSSSIVSIPACPTFRSATNSVSTDSDTTLSAPTIKLTQTSCTENSTSNLSITSKPNLLQTSVSPPVFPIESILNTSSIGANKTRSPCFISISASEGSSIHTSVSGFENKSQLQTISVSKASLDSAFTSVNNIDTRRVEVCNDNNESKKQPKVKQEFVSESAGPSQEDEFTLDLTKDSDELDDFLQNESFEVMRDLKNSLVNGKKPVITSPVREDQASQPFRHSTIGDTDTGNSGKSDCVFQGDKIKGISPKTPEPIQAQEIPVVKDPCISDPIDGGDNLTEHKVKMRVTEDSLMNQTVESVVNKVVAWQDGCISSKQDDKNDSNHDVKSLTTVSDHQIVSHHSHTQQDCKALPHVHVHPFKMQVDTVSSRAPSNCSVTETSSKTSPSGNLTNVTDAETADGSSVNSSTKIKIEQTVSSSKISQDVLENNNVVGEVDKNQNIVTPSLYHDYEAERRFIQDENSLMKEVMKKWGSLGIQTPDTNLSYSNRLRKNNPKVQSRLEGQKISTLLMGITDKHQYNKDAKRFRSHIHSQVNNINNLKQQLQAINRRVREEIDQTIMNFEQKRDTLDRMFVQRKHSLSVQQQLEFCHARRHINPHMLQCQMLQLRCEHQHQRDQLAYIFNKEMNQLKNNHQEHVHMIRNRFEQRAHQLKSFIEQLVNIESAQTDPQFGPHVVTHLIKGPCRSNNNKTSTITVCLPADIATAIIKEDEVYDMFYSHPK